MISMYFNPDRYILDDSMYILSDILKVPYNK